MTASTIDFFVKIVSYSVPKIFLLPRRLVSVGLPLYVTNFAQI